MINHLKKIQCMPSFIEYNNLYYIISLGYNITMNT